MEFTDYIYGVGAALLIIFNSGMIARIIQILQEGQTSDSNDTKRKVIKHIKALVIVDSMSSIVVIISSYYK